MKSPTNTHKLATRFKTKLNYKHSQHGVNKITVKMQQNDWENLSSRKLAKNLKNITGTQEPEPELYNEDTSI